MLDGKQIFELAQNILRAFAELRAFLDQIVAAFAARRINPARHGENLPAIFGREIRRDERAAVRFASTTTVPSVMPATMRLRMANDCLSAVAIERKLRDHRAVRRDALEQFRVLRRETQC